MWISRIATIETTDDNGDKRLHEVGLESGSCDCRQPFEYIMPCKHMAVVIRILNTNRSPDRKINSY